MKRRACKECYKWSNQLTGVVVRRKVENTSLPGYGQTLARVCTVECVHCGHKWKYRKKI